MRALLLVLAMIATAGVWVADLFLLHLPPFRNGWWTLTFFAFPAALLVLAMGGEGKKGLKVAAWTIFVLGLGGWTAMRGFAGRIDLPAPAVAVGDRAPDFLLKDQDGKDARLSDFTDQGRVLLLFFRGSYCPVCRGELRGLASRYEDFKSSRVSVVAVGPQTPEQAKALGLPFPLLSDPDFEATHKYGLFHAKGLLGRDVPRPTTLLLDRNRKVVWMRAATDTRVRPAPEELFEAMKN